MISQTPHYERDGEPLGKSIALIGRDFRSLLDERMKPFDMGGSRWTVIFVLEFLGEPSPQKTIAWHIGIEGPSLVRVLDELEERRLVRRLPDPHDRRVKLVELLPEGYRLHKELVVVGRALEEEVFGVLSPAEQEAFKSMLRRIHDRMVGMDDK